MKHKNISIFIVHAGCKRSCSFCDQRKIAGEESPPSLLEVRAILDKAYLEIGDKSQSEIAFFGGSFTAIPRKAMISLLELAAEYLGADGFYGIRISTRPDAIDDELLELLSSYGVTAIELGAQSMDNSVLKANNRGHDSMAVRNASQKIREHGFSLGLQMMTGLYKSSAELDLFTAREIIMCKPDTVRIYPTVVLENTTLAELYKRGEYFPPDLDKTVTLCGELLLMFKKAGIRVIKLGLHASEAVEESLLAGGYHPALRELCESYVYLDHAKSALNELLGKHEFKSIKAVLYVAPCNISKMIGQHRKNTLTLEKMGYSILIHPRDGLGEFEVVAEKAIGK